MIDTSQFEKTLTSIPHLLWHKSLWSRSLWCHHQLSRLLIVLSLLLLLLLSISELAHMNSTISSDWCNKMMLNGISGSRCSNSFLVGNLSKDVVIVIVNIDCGSWNAATTREDNYTNVIRRIIIEHIDKMIDLNNS